MEREYSFGQASPVSCVEERAIQRSLAGFTKTDGAFAVRSISGEGFACSIGIMECTEVSRAFADVEEIGASLYAIVHAAASGKGASSALAVEYFRGLWESSCGKLAGPGRAARMANVLAEWNSRINAKGFRGRFISVLLSVVDVHERTCTFMRAGAEPPLIYSPSSGRMKTLPVPGMPALGPFSVLPSGLNTMHFSKEKCAAYRLTSGSSLFLGSGDLADLVRRPPTGGTEDFGEERMKEIIAAAFSGKRYTLSLRDRGTEERCFVFDFSRSGKEPDAVLKSLFLAAGIFSSLQDEEIASFPDDLKAVAAQTMISDHMGKPLKNLSLYRKGTESVLPVGGLFCDQAYACFSVR
jgi:hypothetical protein